MKIKKLKWGLAGLGLSAAVIPGFYASDVLAQSYPNKPIRWIVPFTGGTADYTARLIGQKLTDSWGQQVVIENRPGASGMIGTDLGSRAAPDGYTLILGNTAALAVSPNLYKKLPYDPVKSFAPVTLMATTAQVLVVHPSVAAHSLKELVALAKSRPGQLNGGSSGNGEAPHLALEMFKAVAGVNIVHVPYKDTGAAATALLGGQVQVVFSGMVQAMPHVRAGKLRALAVSTVKRSRAAPDVPTIAELGFPNYSVSFWAGVIVPARTPKELVTRLNIEIVKILDMPDVQEKMSDRGLEPMSSTPEQFAAIIKGDIAKYGKVIKDVGLKVD